MKAEKKMPSFKKLTGMISSLSLLSIVLSLSNHFILALIPLGIVVAYVVKFYKKGMKDLADDTEEIEEKDSLFSKFKNKVKSFGKKKNKKKDKKNGLISRIKNRKNKKEKEEVKKDEDIIQDIVEEDEVKENNSKTKIDNIKKQKEALNNLKQDIVDGVYGLKKDQIIQDRINGKEINNFYKQKVKVKK